MEKVLHITLTKHWFDLISSGEKLEEYREIKPYWISRLADVFNNNLYLCFDFFYNDTRYLFKQFDLVIAKNGYGPNVPTMHFIPGRIRIDKPKKEWCHHDTDLTKRVFVIPIKKIIKF